MAKINMYTTLLISAVFWNAVIQGCSLDDARAKLLEPVWLEGPAAPRADDAFSQVRCPEGYYVRRCHANREQNMDGAIISDARTCKAQNSIEAIADLKAVVLCQPKFLVNVMTYSMRVTNPNEVVRCPNGYVMDTCVRSNKWSQNGVYETNWGSGQCSWNKVGGHTPDYMTLSYVCLKATSV